MARIGRIKQISEYNSKHYECIAVMFKNSEKDRIKKAAAMVGASSLNNYIKTLVEIDVDRILNQSNEIEEEDFF